MFANKNTISVTSKAAAAVDAHFNSVRYGARNKNSLELNRGIAAVIADETSSDRDSNNHKYYLASRLSSSEHEEFNSRLDRKTEESPLAAVSRAAGLECRVSMRSNPDAADLDTDPDTSRAWSYTHQRCVDVNATSDAASTGMSRRKQVKPRHLDADTESEAAVTTTTPAAAAAGAGALLEKRDATDTESETLQMTSPLPQTPTGKHRRI